MKSRLDTVSRQMVSKGLKQAAKCLRRICSFNRRKGASPGIDRTPRSGTMSERCTYIHIVKLSSERVWVSLNLVSRGTSCQCDAVAVAHQLDADLRLLPKHSPALRSERVPCTGQKSPCSATHPHAAGSVSL